MSEIHPDYRDLVERSLDPEVQAHLASCAACRVQARIAAEVIDLDPDGLPDVEEARRRMSRARLEASVALSRSLIGEEVAEEDGDLPPGRVVERYVVLRRLGSGGMGTVYLVRHQQLGNVHALKVLHWLSPRVRRRLLREGRVQGRLRHPNIVAVTDVVDVDGAPGLIMEYVDGPSLAELLLEGAPPLAEVDRIAQGILRGVEAAHRAGLVHRDLKPSNVLLATSEEGYLPKVSDFGLARLVEPDPGEETRITRSHVPIGTPAYMSPEQIRDARAADARSDVFSLGAVLYELVTGRRAFEGLDVAEVFDRVRSGEHPPIEVPGVPQRWVRTIERALRTDPAERFADCRELLESWRGERPVTRFPRRGSPRFRRALTAVALFLGGLGAAAVVAFVVLRPRPAPEAPPAAVAPAPDAFDDRPVTGRPADTRIFDIDLSPDGNTVALADRTGLWLQPVARGAPTRIADGTWYQAEFFPDGKHLLATTKGQDGTAVYDVSTGGTRDLLWTRPLGQVRLSPDGERVAFVDKAGLWVVPLAGGPGVRLVALGDRDVLGSFTWSPSGDYIAGIYESIDVPGAWLEITATDGSSSRRVLEAAEVINFAGGTLEWLPPDRLVFGYVHERTLPPVMSLRAVDGASTAPPERFARAPTVHRWTGTVPTRMSASADGHRIAYVGMQMTKDTWIVGLPDPGKPEVITRDEWGEIPTDWLDDHHVLLVSDRSRGRESGRTDRSGDLYVQALDGSAPTWLAHGPVPDHGARRVGDAVVFTRILLGTQGLSTGQAVVKLVPGQSEKELYRFEAPGNANFQFQVRCPRGPTDRCMISEPLGANVRFSWIDLATGERSAPVASGRFYWHAWDVSPDGRVLALFDRSPGRVIFQDLETGAKTEREIPLESPHYAAWSAADGRIYVSGYGTSKDNPDSHRIVWVDQKGKSGTVWSEATASLFAPAPSPDGKRLAFGVTEFDDDVWLLEGRL